jgi:N-acetylmuramoyl-L-alanine amidase
VPPAKIEPGPAMAVGTAGGEVRSLQEALATYGYGVTVSGIYDFATVEVVTAFQRHFRPALIDGIADPSTVATLKTLLTARRNDGHLTS